MSHPAERLAHDRIADLLQSIEDEHGFRVLNFSVDWIDTSSMERRHFMVRNIDMQTARAPGEGGAA